MGIVELHTIAILMDKARAEVYIDVGNKERNEHIFKNFMSKGQLQFKFSAELNWQGFPTSEHVGLVLIIRKWFMRKGNIVLIFLLKIFQN